MSTARRKALLLRLLLLTTFGSASTHGSGGRQQLPQHIEEWHYHRFGTEGGLWEQLYIEQPLPTDEIPWRFWDKAFLRRGSSVTHYDQLRPFFEKLDRGEPVLLMALGSSISASHGGCMHNPSPLMHATAKLRHSGNAGPSCHRDGWISRVLRMINSTWPHAEHALLNLAWPGSNMDRFSRRGHAPPHSPCSQQKQRLCGLSRPHARPGPRARPQPTATAGTGATPSSSEIHRRRT